jgi:hypothetical protein
MVQITKWADTLFIQCKAAQANNVSWFFNFFSPSKYAPNQPSSAHMARFVGLLPPDSRKPETLQLHNANDDAIAGQICLESKTLSKRYLRHWR